MRVHIKLNHSLLLVRSDFHEILQGVFAGEYLHACTDFFYIYYQSKDIVGFCVLTGKLEPPTLTKKMNPSGCFPARRR